MDTNLTLTIEKDVINDAKRYAKQKGVSLSEIVENYFISAMKVDFNNIIDVDGRKLGDDTYISANQFRELFVQKVETSPPAFNDSLFISISKPLSQNKIHPISRDSDYFMNTPLKNVQE